MAVRQWEYKVVGLKKNEVEQQLNTFGSDGWELTAIFFYINSGLSNDYTVFLKREKS